GTDVGVFVSTDDGASWSEFGSGLPNVVVTGLQTFVSGNTRKLRASTYGRGMWQIDLPTLNLAFSANALNFVTIIGGQQQRLLTINNAGNATVSLSSISASAGFSIDSNDCPTALTIGASCNVLLTYSASGTASTAGSLTIVDDAAGSPHVVPLNASEVNL